MGLVSHAEEELKRAGLFDKDSDYEGMIGEAVLEIVKLFSNQGHSGFSAGMTIDILNKLLRFKSLTAITCNPNEWMEVGEGMWQSTRQHSLFSKDGGKTWYDIDERES